jgi:signal transduction histidine kinase
MQTERSPSNHLIGSQQDKVYFMDRLVHDARSFLASIQGYAEIIADHQLQDSADNIQDFGRIIASQAQHLGKMMEDALLCTRISEGSLDLVLKPVRFALLMDAWVSEIKNKVGQDFQFQNELGGCLVEADVYFLRDAINRVIETVSRISHQKILLSARVESVEDVNQAIICVENDGQVIPEGDLPVLFQMFGRIKENKSKDVAGNGMDLFIAKALLDRQHGTISIQSAQGQGTIFRISIPIYKDND